METYDVIVVGAGIFGLCAAYHCQREGLKTLLVEQYELHHKNGSSHGRSRIIRYAHTEREYVPLVHDAYQQITELEKESGKRLWKQTGLLWASTTAEIDSISEILDNFHISHEKIKGEEVANRYPQFTFDNNYAALIDPMGGVLYADEWLHAFQEAFLKIGGEIREKVEVLCYSETTGEIVELQTTSGLFRTRKAIFTVGPWITKLFPNIPLNIQPESIAVCYWKTIHPEDTPLLNSDKFPVFIVSGGSGLAFGFFGLPSIDYEGCAKICFHSGEHIEGLNHPDVVSKELIDRPAEFIKNHMPIIDATNPVHVDKCKYTISEDNHYVIGHYPGSKNVLIGGCGSGSGFKVAPSIGKVLAEMAAGEKPSIDVSFFSFERFPKNSV